MLSNGKREGFKSLNDWARLVPRSDDTTLEKKGTDGESGALQRQASLALWSTKAVQDLRRDIVLLQRSAGSGKSLFVWIVYSRFGRFTNSTMTNEYSYT